MLAQFDNYRLQPGKPHENILPSYEAGLNFAGEPAHYRFYEHDGETYLTMHFREFSQAVRVVTLQDEAVEYLDDAQKASLGENATAHFAEHIQSTETPPKDLTYPA